MTGIICAMQEEASVLLKQIKDLHEEKIYSQVYYTGKINNRDVVVSVCGIGKTYAAVCAQTMVLKYKPEEIINLGVAGGIGKNIKKCDTVIATKVCQHDMDTSPLGDPVGMISGINRIYFDCDKTIVKNLYDIALKNGLRCHKGVIASGDQFISSDEKKEYLKKNFKAISCEMESGAIGMVCHLTKTPFAIIRSISDGGDENAAMDFPQFLKIAIKNGTDILLTYLGL